MLLIPQVAFDFFSLESYGLFKSEINSILTLKFDSVAQQRLPSFSPIQSALTPSWKTTRSICLSYSSFLSVNSTTIESSDLSPLLVHSISLLCPKAQPFMTQKVTIFSALSLFYLYNTSIAFFVLKFKLYLFSNQNQINLITIFTFQKQINEKQQFFYLSQMNLSKNSLSFRIICLNCSVNVIEIVVIGTEKQILSMAPLNRAKNPSFFTKRVKPWKAFLYPKIESSSLPPPFWATSALWICILSLTISNGVVAHPATDPATDEHKILSVRVGFCLSLTKLAFIFSKAVKKMALKGPKKSKVAPKAYFNEILPYKVRLNPQTCVFFAWPRQDFCRSIILFMTEPAFFP